MRRPVALTVVAAAVLGVGAIAARDVTLRFQHPRDEVAYQAYVQAFPTGSTSIEGVPETLTWADVAPEAILATGERACDWIRGRPDAPNHPVPSGQFDRFRLSRAYLDTTGTGGEERDLLSVTTNAAWSELCWWEARVKTTPLTREED